MTYDEKLEVITEAFAGLNDNEKITVFNEYCSEKRFYGDRAFYMDELDDYFGDASATDILNQIDSEEFDIAHPYFREGSWGLKSYTDADEVIDDAYLLDEVCQWVLDKEKNFGFYELREAFDEIEEAEDEDEEDEEE